MKKEKQIAGTVNLRICEFRNMKRRYFSFNIYSNFGRIVYIIRDVENLNCSPEEKSWGVIVWTLKLAALSVICLFSNYVTWWKNSILLNKLNVMFKRPGVIYYLHRFYVKWLSTILLSCYVLIHKFLSIDRNTLHKTIIYLNLKKEEPHKIINKVGLFYSVA